VLFLVLLGEGPTVDLLVEVTMNYRNKKNKLQKATPARRDPAPPEAGVEPHGLEGDAPKPRLLDRVRQAIRTRHYSSRTEKAYVHWIKRFIFFHDKRQPDTMGEREISAFLDAPREPSQSGRVDPESGVVRRVVPLSPCPSPRAR
jgi:hypothetical protein